MSEFKSYTTKHKESLLSIIFAISTFAGLLGFFILNVIDRAKIKSYGVLYLLSIIMFFVGIIWLKFQYRIKKYKNYLVLDELIINDKFLRVGNNQYELENLNNLRFDFNGINGEAISRFNVADGSKNTLLFKKDSTSF